MELDDHDGLESSHIKHHNTNFLLFLINIEKNFKVLFFF